MPEMDPLLELVEALGQKILPDDWPARLRQLVELCPALPNLFSKVAWKQYVATDLAYDKALPWMEKDCTAGRLCGDWLLHYAHARAACSLEYESVVEAAYESDPVLLNGYSRCAWMTFFTRNYQPENALPSFELDLMQGRLGGQYKIFYAMLLACLGMKSEAQAAVAECYRRDRSAVDGYVLLEWVACVIGGQTPGHTGFKRDRKLGRSSCGGMINAAGIHACTGNRSLAEALVQQAYDASASSAGGFTTIAAIGYRINRDIDDALRLLQMDADAGRQLSFHRVVHAVFLLSAGRREDAERLCRAAVATSGLVGQIAVSWLCRSGYDTTIINELFRPELRGWMGESLDGLWGGRK